MHNLRNTSDTAEATMLFMRQVMQCYDGEVSHLGGLLFTADLGEGVPPVHHIGLCYEFSKAGNEFNAKNREHLLQRLLVVVWRSKYVEADIEKLKPPKLGKSLLKIPTSIENMPPVPPKSFRFGTWQHTWNHHCPDRFAEVGAVPLVAQVREHRDHRAGGLQCCFGASDFGVLCAGSRR